MAARSVPRYTLHKPTGYARVRIDGKDHYLGEFGSKKSHKRYSALIADWQARQEVAPTELTVRERTLLYMEHCKVHYRRDGHLVVAIVAHYFLRSPQPQIAWLDR